MPTITEIMIVEKITNYTYMGDTFLEHSDWLAQVNFSAATTHVTYELCPQSNVRAVCGELVSVVTNF